MHKSYELSTIDYLQFTDENIEAQEHVHYHTATMWQDGISDTSSATILTHFKSKDIRVALEPQRWVSKVSWALGKMVSDISATHFLV